MSWLARSIANSLRLDEEEEEHAEKNEHKNPDAAPVSRHRQDDAALTVDRPRDSAEDRGLSNNGDTSHANGDGEDLEGDYDLGRGVKEDLSELKDSLTRQFWGVASFLAPPPPPPPPPPLLSQRSVSLCVESKSDAARIGIEEEEDQESVEYEKRESGQYGELENFSQSEDYYANIIEDAIGITDEVLAFARNIAHHPETWLDFPLAEEEEFDDFDISDTQYKHALAVEHLAPRLAALRIELCPVHMSMGYFWMVYFVLLYSRLNKRDAEMLSSPQLVQARAMWMQELQKQTKEQSYWSGTSTYHSKETTDSPHSNFTTHSFEDTYFVNTSDRISPLESSSLQITDEHEIEKNPYNEIEYIDKTVIKEDPTPNFHEKDIVVGPSTEISMQHDNYVEDDDDEDDWLKEDSDLIGYSRPSNVVNEEDISFSDLEDDMDCTTPIRVKIASN